MWTIWLLLGSAFGKHCQQMRGGRPERLGYFSLLPLGSDFVSATLGSPGTGAGTGPVPERGVPKILSKLGLPVTIFHGLCLQQSGLLLPHSVLGPWPSWVAALGFCCLSSSCVLSSTSLGLCFPWPSLRKQLTNLPILHS